MANILKKVVGNYDREKFRILNTEMSFAEYLELVYKKPQLLRNSWQMIFDMIMEKGSSQVEEYRKSYTNFHFFDDPEIPIIGLIPMKDSLVRFIKGAAGGYGTERRILLLHGPVGSSKSTILRLIKRGLEKYSQTDDGAWYSYKWVNLPTGPEGIYTDSECDSPMHEQPFKLLPMEVRIPILQELNAILEEQKPDKKDVYTLKCNDELNPLCRKFMSLLLKKYDGDIEKIYENHIRVVRKVYSESERCGIATFQPKDEKNQDSTELTGDMNFRQIGYFGTDSDPRCIVGGTMVSTEKGFKNIVDFIPDNLEEGEFSEVNLSVTSIGGTGHADSVYNGGKKPVITVITRPGYEITASAQHKLLTMNLEGNTEWKKVGELSSGDYVAMFRNAYTFSDSNYVFDNFTPQYYGNEKNKPIYPSEMTPELGYLFGLWIGDGHYYANEEKHQYCIGWTQMEPERREMFAALAKKLFDVDFITKQKHGVDGLLEIGCKNLYMWLTKVAGLKGKSRDKHIPDCVLSSKRDVIIAVIQGLWETDGNVRNDKEKNNLSNTASFSSCSKTLCKQVQQLLLALGVVSFLRKTSSDALELRVYGNNVNKLCELIPSLKNRFTVGKLENAEICHKVDVVPYVKPLLKEVYKKASNRHDLKKRYSGNIFDKNKSNITYKTLKDFRNDVEIEDMELLNKLDSIIDDNYLWVEVVDCKDGQIEQVYDFSVMDTHAYWANGFVSHNSFSFDGEFNAGNRGIIEFIEALKLDTAFLYDLLGASQEQSIKPKKFSQVAIDEAIFCHSNNPEYEKLKSNQYMEAFKDRTTKIDVPYTIRWSEELQILEKDYGPGKVRQHIAPHTLEIAALWSVLTRLEDDKDGKLTLVEKAELYNGKMMPNWTEDAVKELKDKYPDEGMSHGVSIRYLQDKISSCLANNHDYINMFMVMNELRDGLEHSSLMTNKDQISRYIACVDLALKKLTDILKNEVQKALVGDEDSIIRLCSNYIDNVMAFINKSKIKDPITGQDRKPDERLMRQIEEKIQIPDVGSPDFRRQIAAFIGDLAHKNRQFKWDSNPQLKKALELKLFEDVKDTIKLSALTNNGASVVDKDIQEKLDALKARLIKNYGYNERSATDVLTFVSGIFSRGDVEEN